MTTLTELQQQMHAVLRGTRGVEEVSGVLGVDPKRLGIYRGFVRGHIRSSLDKLYPMTRHLAGAEVWDTLFEDFFATCPATTWELNASVEPFYGYLDAQISAGEVALSPFLASLAQYEWEEFATYVHPAAIPKRESLAAAIVNPTVTALEFNYAVIPFVVAHPDPTALVPTTPLPAHLPEPQLALLFRRADTYGVAYYTATPELLFAVRVTMEAMTVADAATQSGQPVAAVEAALAKAESIGLILMPAP